MSVTEQVRAYVERRPYIQEALSQQIINYSALARQVSDEIDGSFEAIKMALRRHSDDLRERREERATNIARILGGTSIELRNNVTVCKSVEPAGDEIFARTENGYTVMRDGEADCEGEAIPDQVMITLRSSEDLERTPGVLAYVMSLLAGREINVTECISCREDTHIVVHEDDATEAFSLLTEKLGE